jgi:hypothetical protein
MNTIDSFVAQLCLGLSVTTSLRFTGGRNITGPLLQESIYVVSRELDQYDVGGSYILLPGSSFGPWQ